jgi:molybdate/tungstate transport system permease protein
VAFYLSMRPNAVLEALVDVPASVPHPVMGIGILLLFSEYTPIGQLARSLGSSPSLSISWATSSITLLEAKVTVDPFVPVVEYLRTIHDFRIE